MEYKGESAISEITNVPNPERVANIIMERVEKGLKLNIRIWALANP